jgi:hypothetical protein
MMSLPMHGLCPKQKHKPLCHFVSSPCNSVLVLIFVTQRYTEDAQRYTEKTKKLYVPY